MSHKRIERPIDEALGDLVVEAAGDDREAAPATRWAPA